MLSAFIQIGFNHDSHYVLKLHKGDNAILLNKKLLRNGQRKYNGVVVVVTLRLITLLYLRSKPQLVTLKDVVLITNKTGKRNVNN